MATSSCKVTERISKLNIFRFCVCTKENADTAINQVTHNQTRCPCFKGIERAKKKKSEKGKHQTARSLKHRITYHSQLINRPRLLDIPQSPVQIGQLPIDDRLRLLRALHRRRLKRLDSLDLPPDIVRRRLVWLHLPLDLVHDGLVVEYAAVVLKVDRLRLLRQHRDAASGIIVALLERRERRRGRTFQAELRRQSRPVDF